MQSIFTQKGCNPYLASASSSYLYSKKTPGVQTRRCAEVDGGYRSSTYCLLDARKRHSHSVINRSRKAAWLKGFAMIVVSFTVGIYRQKSSFNGAGYGAICAASTLPALSSIGLRLRPLELALKHPALRFLTAASHRVFWPPAQARPGMASRTRGETSCGYSACTSAIADSVRARSSSMIGSAVDA